MNPTRWRRSRKIAFAGAGQAALPLYPVLTPQDLLNVKSLTISTDAPAELVVYFGLVAGDRTDEDNAIVGLFLAANGGASPDVGCLGSWSPLPGLSLQVWASAACNVWVAASGTNEAV